MYKNCAFYDAVCGNAVALHLNLHLNTLLCEFENNIRRVTKKSISPPRRNRKPHLLIESE